ncbi:DUF3347 domain-containing protein [Opitutus terrae]|uniref:DUF3347 domain-containing protein n=1 Tax=Opitutus terrae TaxID=107709 RepID=UPI0013052E65|nr:DUF3347 domain-containing protein [Opitutus terrae]
MKIADALAADNLAAARAAATALTDYAGVAGQKQIAEQALDISKAADIAAARGRFKSLTLAIEPLAAGVDGYTVMTCAMAKADWVQASGDVKNPYFGKSMLSCGEPKKIDSASGHNHGDGSGHGCGDATSDQGHAGHGQHGCG